MKEITQRVTRMESRLVQLGDYVGTNLRAKMRIDLVKDDLSAWVSVDAFDVSISRILRELKRLGVPRGTQLPVRCDGRTIATVFAE